MRPQPGAESALLAFYGPDSKGIVWEHNSRVGDASATEMSARGEHNVGQLSRQLFGEQAYILGFGTDHGTVAAASNWNEPMDRIVPAREGSYERVFHDAGIAACALHLRNPSRRAVREDLASQLLERAIGVVYRPDTELQSLYFYASLPRQFDEYIWFDETEAVHVLESAPSPQTRELPDTYPFGVRFAHAAHWRSMRESPYPRRRALSAASSRVSSQLSASRSPSRASRFSTRVPCSTGTCSSSLARTSRR